MSIKIKEGKNEDSLTDSLANTGYTWAGDRDLSVRCNKRNRQALNRGKKSFLHYRPLLLWARGTRHSLVLPLLPDLLGVLCPEHVF